MNAAAGAEDKPDPLAVFPGSWVCIEQGGKKPGREVKLIVNKTGGDQKGGTGGGGARALSF